MQVPQYDSIAPLSSYKYRVFTGNLDDGLVAQQTNEVEFVAKRWHGIASYSSYYLESREQYQHTRTHLYFLFGRMVRGLKSMEWIELLPPLGRLQWAFFSRFDLITCSLRLFL